MAPKKDAKASAGAAGPEAALAAYKAQNEALQKELENRTERLKALEAQVSQMHAKMQTYGSAAMASEKNLQDMQTESSRQYRSMQLRYEQRIAELEQSVQRLTAENQAARVELNSAAGAMGAQLRVKDEIIVKLQKRVDAVLNEAGDHLTEVMRRLTLKIGGEDGQGGGGTSFDALASAPSSDLAATTLKKLKEMTV